MERRQLWKWCRRCQGQGFKSMTSDQKILGAFSFFKNPDLLSKQYLNVSYAKNSSSLSNRFKLLFYFKILDRTPKCFFHHKRKEYQEVKYALINRTVLKYSFVCICSVCINI